MRSRHRAHTQRVIGFAFRQRQNTQRFVRAIATRQEHAEGHRFCLSTTPKHAEGCRFCTFFTKCRGSRQPYPLLRHKSISRGIHQTSSRHPSGHHPSRHPSRHPYNDDSLTTTTSAEKPSAMLSGKQGTPHPGFQGTLALKPQTLEP